MAEVALKLDSEPAALTWSEPIRSLGVHILKSTCGRFSIHAEKVGGRWRYEALVRTDIWNNMLGVCGSKDEAIALCEARAGETA